MTHREPHPIVSVRGATCILGGRRVLNEVSLDVKRGQVVVTHRAVGRRKTTLLRLMNHLEALSTAAKS